ncbi:MAG: hypothetical protein BWX58_01137 [Deltaproteobacteria bacterium ADurb.Bin026]|jgi:phage/plasmid-associated DNA primase|nr:MAG: hypothetical protein BWX58_01137 [Deltaproteobacteria bacterium ADurb.Bin026]
MHYDISILQPDRAADFMATDPAFIDSVVQRDYQKYIEEGGKKVVVAKAATSNVLPPDKPIPQQKNKVKPMQLALF